MTDIDAAAYRLRAAACMDVAQESSDPGRRLVLLNMAQSWLALAEHAAKIQAFLAQGMAQRSSGQRNGG